MARPPGQRILGALVAARHLLVVPAVRNLADFATGRKAGGLDMSWLLSLFPGRAYIYVAVLMGAFAAGGTTAWKVQNWRADAKEKEHVEQVLIAEKELRALDTRRASVAAAAQNAAVGRGIDLRRAADGSRAALLGLSDATATALREADANHNACLVRATTLSELLTASTKEYRDLGEKASRHVSDIQTLIDAWPKE